MCQKRGGGGGLASKRVAAAAGKGGMTKETGFAFAVGLAGALGGTKQSSSGGGTTYIATFQRTDLVVLRRD